MQPDICILKASWDGLSVKYVVSDKLPLCSGNTLMMRVAILPKGVVAASIEQFESDWLSEAQKTPLPDYLQIILSLSRFEQIVDQKILSPNQLPILVKEITDPSILHLAHLLRAEMETPKPLSQQFICSIVTILTTHCLQQL
ncbi:MAG: hypothetical protein KME46_08385 [Brasilonema angustatum HA4187-MV1]|jgi:hypothetical protein|nr:hypothetical protein [Brasilonema angustatum HA4187-MV1]